MLLFLHSVSADENLQPVIDHTGKKENPGVALLCDHVCAKQSSYDENYQRFLEMGQISKTIQCNRFICNMGLRLRKDKGAPRGSGQETIALAQTRAEGSPRSMKAFCKNVIMKMKLSHFFFVLCIVALFLNLVSSSSLMSESCRLFLTMQLSSQRSNDGILQQTMQACTSEAEHVAHLLH